MNAIISQMKLKILFSLFLLLVSVSVLTISILRTASVVPEFPRGSVRTYDSETLIDYPLVYPGEVLPGHPMWGVKAVRDRLWLISTTRPDKKADLLLLLADKRISAAKALMESGDNTNALLSLVKAEQYLLAASDDERSMRVRGHDTTEFLRRMALSSLKHREILNNAKYILPDAAVAEIVLSENLAIEVYERSKRELMNKNEHVPESPF